MARARRDKVPTLIEARTYHADHARLVAHYDGLRKETGCAMNLDLQRIAIPACDEAEARWMLKGRRPARIVVENPADRDILRRVAYRDGQFVDSYAMSRLC